MQVGTVTSRFAVNATAWIRGMEQVTSTWVKQNVAVTKAREGMTAWARESKLAAAGAGLVQRELKNFTANLGQNAKDMIGHRSAVRQYRQEMGQLNSQLGQLNQTASRTNDVSKQLFNLAGISATVAIINTGAQKLKDFAEQAMKAAAEVQTLDTVLALMGKNSQYSIGFLRDQVDMLRDSGIEAAAAARGITDFLKTGLPLGRIKELSRLAQDLAVIGGSNSTESFQRILWGITTGQTDVLRVAGLNVSFETAYAKAAAAAKKSVSSLTEAEKLAARLNEVMKQAPTVAGAYKAAMETAGKQLSSMPRLIDDVRVALGNVLLPVFKNAIFATNEWLKALRNLIENGPLGNWLARQATTVANAISKISSVLGNMLAGANLNKTLATIDGFIDKLKSLGKVGGAGLAGIFSGILGQLPLIGRFLAPFTGWQVAVATFIASSAKLRKGLTDIVKAILDAAAKIMDALLPAFRSMGTTVEDLGARLGGLATIVARQITIFGEMAAMLISAAIPAVHGLIEALKFLWQMVGMNPVTEFLGWIAKLVGGSEKGRMAVIAFALGVKTFTMYLGSAMKTAAMFTAFDAINRSVQMANGNLQAFNGFLSTSIGRMKNAAATSAILGVAIIGITMELQKMAAFKVDTAKRIEEIFTAAKESGGTAELMKAMNDELDRANANAREAAGGTNAWAESNNKVLNVLGEVAKRSSAVFDEIKKTSWDTSIIDWFRPMWEASEELKIVNSEIGKVLDEMAMGWKDSTDRLVAQTAKAAEELQSSKDVIASITGSMFSPEMLEGKTPGMIKAYEDSLAQINQTVNAWTEDFMGIGTAILDKEVQSWDDLMAFYDRQVNRVAAFWMGVDWLAMMGLNQSMIDELIKGGPAKFGEALQDLMVQANTMPPEALQAQIDRLNSQRQLADQITKLEEEKYAAQAMMSDEYQQKLQAEAAVQQKVFDDLVSAQMTGLNDLSGGMDAIIQQFYRSGDVSQDVKDRTVEAVIGLKDALAAAEEAVKSGTTIDAQAISNNLNQIIGVLPANLMSAGIAAMNGLNAIVASNNELVKVAGDLGIRSGSSFTSAFHRAVQGALAAVPLDLQAKLGVPGAQDAALKQAQANALMADAKVKYMEAMGSSNLYPQEPDTKAADAAAKDAENIAKRVADVYKNNPPLKLFSEAMDEVWGKQERYITTLHGMTDAQDGLAQSLIDTAKSTDSWDKKQRAIEGAVISAVKAIREQVEAMADLGMIGNSVGAMTAAVAERIDDLKRNLPGLIANMQGLGNTAQSVEDQLSSVHDAIDKLIGKFMDAKEATFAAEEAVDNLAKAYLDQIDLLTNTALSDKDVRDIKRATNKELINSVRAIQNEAKALAANGEIGADAASQMAWINAELKKLEQQFPALKPEIEEYTRRLEAIPEEVKTQAELDVASAIAFLDYWKASLATVPPVAYTKLQILVDDASVSTAMNNAINSASAFNSLRLGDLNTERRISNAMWDQVLALESQRLGGGPEGGGFLGAMARGIIGYVQTIIANTRAALQYDTGGMLPPGQTIAYNMTGKPEYVFTSEQVRALHMMGGQGQGYPGSGSPSDGSGVTVERLYVQSLDPPRQWLSEGLWRASRGFAYATPTNDGGT